MIDSGIPSAHNQIMIATSDLSRSLSGFALWQYLDGRMSPLKQFRA